MKGKRVLRFDSEHEVRRAEQLARKVLASWLSIGIPEPQRHKAPRATLERADGSERELWRALKEEGGGRWRLFEGMYRRPPKDPRESAALRFLTELAGARAALKHKDWELSAREAFKAGVAFARMERVLAERPPRRKVTDEDVMEALKRHRHFLPNQTATARKEAVASELGVTPRTVERATRGRPNR